MHRFSRLTNDLALGSSELSSVGAERVVEMKPATASNGRTEIFIVKDRLNCGKSFELFSLDRRLRLILIGELMRDESQGRLKGEPFCCGKSGPHCVWFAATASPHLSDNSGSLANPELAKYSIIT